jgi:uncharacterized membrane protein YdcZ (DUF606 family)
MDGLSRQGSLQRKADQTATYQGELMEMTVLLILLEITRKRHPRPQRSLAPHTRLAAVGAMLVGAMLVVGSAAARHPAGALARPS